MKEDLTFKYTAHLDVANNSLLDERLRILAFSILAAQCLKASEEMQAEMKS